jgi:predicted flap endonuclease-1-like 5' DNA nuclease
MTLNDALSGNWPLIAIVVVVAIVLAWWLLVASRKTRIERTGEPPSEGLPARRNQALIDSMAAANEADLPPPTPQGLAGVGEAIAATATPMHQPIAGDDLKKIKGIGPKLENRLNSLGVTNYSQIAAWDDGEIDRIDAQLGAFAGRIRRDDWPTQAKYLDAGDMPAFEQRFGRL